MTATTETAAVSHRLVNLRARSAGCSCGAAYVGEGSADLRDQHRAHKLAPVPAPAKKATARKAPAKAATKAAKPRPRRAVKATAA